MVRSTNRMNPHEPADQGNIVAAIGQMADGLGSLFTESLSLAKVELARDAREAVLNIAKIALFGALIFVGYVLSCFALAIAISSFMLPAVAFLAVALVNLIGGAAGAWLAAKSLQKIPGHALEATVHEAKETVRELKEIKDLNNPCRSLVPTPEPSVPVRVEPRPPEVRDPA